MLFSIITICYNPGSVIKTAIESVIGQDYSHIEYIIIDGGSNDGTSKIISSYSDDIDHFVSEPDKGLYDALNKGVALARGDVIGFVHADDFLASPNVLSNIESAFSENVDVDVDAVYGDKIYVSQQNIHKIVRYWKAGVYSPKKLRYGWMPPHLSFYLKRAQYENVKLSGGVYFNPEYKISGDYEFMLRVLRQKNVQMRYIDCPIIKMRTGGVSNSGVGNLFRKMKEDYRAIKANRVGGIHTLMGKNIRKIHQIFVRE